MQDADTIVAQAQNAIMRSVRPDTLGTKGRFWRKAAVQSFDRTGERCCVPAIDRNRTCAKHDDSDVCDRNTFLVNENEVRLSGM